MKIHYCIMLTHTYTYVCIYIYIYEYTKTYMSINADVLFVRTDAESEGMFGGGQGKVIEGLIKGLGFKL